MINIIFSEEYKNHDTGNHPESIKRIEVVNNLIMLLTRPTVVCIIGLVPFQIIA